MTDLKNKVPSESPKTDDKTNNGEALKKQLSDLTGGKFDDPEKLAKAYKELESKLGEQSREVQEVREFMKVAEPVFNVIKEDEDLFKAIDKKLTNPDSDNPKKPENKVTDQDEVKNTTRDLLMMQFESKHNFDKLPADMQKELRAEIGKQLSEMGMEFKSIDLRRLNPVLEKAYTLAKSGITDKSTQEAIAEAENNDGTISSLPQSSGKTEKVVTPEEASVAEKLGLTREQYLAGKK